MTPRISVIIPVYNAASFVRDAVASVRAQTLHDWEIIFVDDGSTDDSPGVIAELAAASPCMKALHQPNAGPASARNYGLQHARGAYIAFLDADDLYPPDKFEMQAARLDADPTLDFTLGRIQYVWLPGGEPIRLRFKEPDHTVIHVHLGSGLFRRRVFEQVGVFDVTLRYGEDLDWMLRAYEADSRLIIVKAVTLHYRLHDANMTRGRTLQEINSFRALKKSLDRRRQSGMIKPLPKWSDFDEAQLDDSAMGSAGHE